MNCQSTILLFWHTLFNFSNAPIMVRDFIKLHSALWKEKKVLCVATMGLFSGDGAGCSARLLKNTVQKLLADYISICLTPFVM